MSKTASYVAAPFTGGASLAIPYLMDAMQQPKLPQTSAMPTPPDQEAVTRQSQLDTQKANALRSTDMTNIGGSKGILTDPNADYKKKTLLGS